MYFILERELDMMGGAAPYHFCTTASTQEEVEAYIKHRYERHEEQFLQREVFYKDYSKESWDSWKPQFIITKTVA